MSCLSTCPASVHVLLVLYVLPVLYFLPVLPVLPDLPVLPYVKCLKTEWYTTVQNDKILIKTTNLKQFLWFKGNIFLACILAWICIGSGSAQRKKAGSGSAKNQWGSTSLPGGTVDTGSNGYKKWIKKVYELYEHNFGLSWSWSCPFRVAPTKKERLPPKKGGFGSDQKRVAPVPTKKGRLQFRPKKAVPTKKELLHFQ